MQLGTAWDVVRYAYGCITDAFPECPDNEIVAFLAPLSATEQALAINPVGEFWREGSSNRDFKLPKTYPGQITNLKAALAQAHGEASQ